MTAYEIPGEMYTLQAAADIERHRFIKMSEEGAKYAESGTDPIVGASYMEAKEGQPLSIAGSGIVMVEAATTITVGAEVGATSDGKATAGAGGGVALTGATAGGELITVKLGAASASN